MARVTNTARRESPRTQEQPITEPMEVEIVDDDQLEYTFGEDEDEYGDISQTEHGANLAEVLDEETLQACSTDLITEFESDLRSRNTWEKTYINGLEYLGMSNEERKEPWEGSSGVFHPLLTEAVVRFQSQAILEIFPAAGPARTQVVGTLNPDKMKQAARVEQELNYITTDKMTEYRNETEQMLFRLPMAGSGFKKIYYDPIEGRPVAMMVPAEDFIVPYGASDLRTCERYTHRMRKTPNELLKLMTSGFYKHVDLAEPVVDYSKIQEAHDELSGQKVVEDDGRYVLLEMNVDYDFGEDENGVGLPYVITLEKASGHILSIRRNWREQDQHRRKRIHYSHYQYMPGLGFYGIGLVHLIGGLAQSSTSILRQLVDAGTLSNLLAGFKARGMRVVGDDEPLQPGEFRDIDVPSGNIRDSIYTLPFKEPSQTLYNLLNTIVDEGRRIASIADLEIGDMNQQAPVGTTLALLERSMKVMSAVHARLHAALRDELRLIAEIIGTNMPPQYDYDDNQEFNRQEDFSSKVDILPVSDPNAATMSQRVVQYQAVLQMSQMNPELFNLPLVYRKGLEAMAVQDGDQLVPMPDELQPQDPITENMGFITGRPTKAFLHQDHESHLQAHIAAMADPEIQAMIGQSTQAARIQGAMEAHIAEHLAFKYRKDIEEELGTELPPPEQPLPPEAEVKLSKLVADAANRLFYRHQDDAERRENEQLLMDPAVQIDLREQDRKERETKLKEKKALEDQKEKIRTRKSRERVDLVRAAVDLAKTEDERLSEEAKTVAKIAGEFEKAEISKSTTENKK